jgi:hypothetical protein
MTELKPEIRRALQKLPKHVIVAERCRRSFYYFIQTFWSEIIDEEPVWNWHIEEIANVLQEAGERVFRGERSKGDIVINLPPGQSKSTICTVMFPVWCWVKKSSTRIMTASYSATLSTDHSVLSRDIVQSEKFMRCFPEIELRKDMAGKTSYKNTKGGQRITTSVGGTATGKHAHIKIVDDPIDPQGAASDKERETANNFMNKTLSTRNVNKKVALTILVMQRLHEDDPTGNWLTKQEEEGKKIIHVCLPAEDSEHVRPRRLRKKYVDGLLDPVRLGREDLDELQVELGSLGYAGQMGQTPTPEGGAIWKKTYIIPIKRKDIPMDKLQKVGSDWDLAYTEEEKNSASAYVEAGKHDNKMYVIGCRAKWKEFPDLISWMKEETFPHYIEAKASGKSAKQTLTKQGIPAIEVEVQGGDKIARTKLATPYGEAGMIYCADDIIDYLLNDSKQGILRFPKTGTDLNDAFVQSINRLLTKKVKKKRSSGVVKRRRS